MLNHLAHYPAYLLVRLLVCVAQTARLETCRRVAGTLATVFTVLGVRRRVISENLRHAFPEVPEVERKRLAWRMWEHLFLFAAEVAHTARKVHETNWRDYVTLKNDAALVRLLLSDRPLIMVGGHYGNFELHGYVMALFGYEMFSVARPLDNPLLDDYVHRFRKLRRQRILTKKGDYDRLVEILASGGKVQFLADQYAGTKGCWVDFFGRPASVHKAIALLALNHQAPLATGYCRRTGKPLHYEMSLEGLLDPASSPDEFSSVSSLTQWFTGQLEQIVREAPDQYWWLHRRWKDHRPAKRRQRRAA